LAFAASSCSPPQNGAAEPEIGSVEPGAAPAPSESPSRAARRDAPPDSGGGYQYIDETGRVRMAPSLEAVPERQRSTATALARARSGRRSPAVEEPLGSAQRADVVIYTTPGCGWCRRAMAYFDKKGVDYTNRDVSSDPEAYADYESITGGRSGVPVIVVGDEWMQGWNPGRFDELLASAN
jgi:glutaredoxin